MQWSQARLRSVVRKGSLVSYRGKPADLSLDQGCCHVGHNLPIPREWGEGSLRPSESPLVARHLCHSAGWKNALSFAFPASCHHECQLLPAVSRQTRCWTGMSQTQDGEIAGCRWLLGRFQRTPTCGCCPADPKLSTPFVQATARGWCWEISETLAIIFTGV